MKMIKSVLFAGAVSALVLGSTAAHAIPNHVYSTSNPLVLTGPATLNSNNCELTLSATLGDTDNPSVHIPANWYNVITNITGTNDPLLSDPACAGISVVGGSGAVTSSNTISITNLQIRLVLPTGPVVCSTGSFTANATNISPTDVEVEVDAVTPCGAITALLAGVGQID